MPSLLSASLLCPAGLCPGLPSITDNHQRPQPPLAASEILRPTGASCAPSCREPLALGPAPGTFLLAHTLDLLGSSCWQTVPNPTGTHSGVRLAARALGVPAPSGFVCRAAFLLQVRKAGPRGAPRGPGEMPGHSLVPQGERLPPGSHQTFPDTGAP